MQNKREQILTQPALVPIAGSYDKKPRILEREVTTVGRARGSDLCLEANEVSTLHCVLYRAGENYRLRDCNSRCGTRINGEAVKSQTLHDGDIVNLGPFSFEFRLPPPLFPKDHAKLDPVQVEHWKQSRKRLGQLALRMRKRLAGQSPRQEEWANKAHLLKEKVRSYDQRFSELEGAEKELAAERDQLAREAEALRQRVQKQEGELARRFAEAEETIRRQWQEFQQRCQAEEARAQLAAAGGALNAGPPDPCLAQLQRDTETERQRLRDLEDHLTRQQELVQREQQEFSTMKEQWVKAQTKSSEALEEQQAALAQQELAVRAQKAELMRMMAELKKLQDDLRSKPRAELASLQAELDQARAENAELRVSLEALQHVPAPSPDSDELLNQVRELRAEVELLNEELLNKEQALAALQQAPPDTGAAVELAQVRTENDMLKTLLAQTNELAADQSQQADAPGKSENDLERYESELNEYRRQLETDRAKFNKEVEVLRERNQELDEAVREMEMEMSKERAELARERMRLERVREEVKADSERLQREMAVRDSMAGVQKLRDELTQKQAPATGKGDKPLTERFRTMRGLVGDRPATGS